VISIVDTHLHLIYPQRLRYDWTTGIRHLEDRAFDYDTYLAAAQGCGISSNVFMEATTADPAEHDETAFISSLAAAPGNTIVGIVAASRPESDGFERFLDTLAKPVVGLRRVLHTEPDEVSRGTRFRENLRAAAERALTFDLCVLARQLPIALELVEACPEVDFVLDHCGVPDIAAGALDPWREHIDLLAARPNVVCKISGLLAYCDPQAADGDAVRPYVEHAIGAFGRDRVLWGSDWPLVEITSTLASWVEISRALVAGEPESDQQKLFHDNALRVYGLTKAP
jgi:predicted TIM-barrel fold metal-dependent hydrolase